MAAIPFMNTTDQVKMFTIRLRYQQGEASELSGAVSDLRPNQSSVATVNTYSLLTCV